MARKVENLNAYANPPYDWSLEMGANEEGKVHHDRFSLSNSWPFISWLKNKGQMLWHLDTRPPLFTSLITCVMQAMSATNIHRWIHGEPWQPKFFRWFACKISLLFLLTLTGSIEIRWRCNPGVVQWVT